MSEKNPGRTTPAIRIFKSDLSAVNPLKDRAEKEGVRVVTADAGIAAAFEQPLSDTTALKGVLQKAPDGRFVRSICVWVREDGETDVRLMRPTRPYPDGWKALGALLVDDPGLDGFKKLEFGLELEDRFMPMLRAILNGRVLAAEIISADGSRLLSGPFFSEFEALDSIMRTCPDLWRS